jgi:protein-disulfide isomerase
MKKPLLLILATLPLALAACNKSGDSAPGAPIAAVAPPAGKAWADVVAKTDDGAGVVMGNPGAPIRLVEYGSLSCPHCAKLAQEGMATITGTYVASGKVSYEFRSFAIHPQDIPLTVLARCGAPDTFFGLVEQIYTNFDAMSAGVEKGIEKAKAASSLPPAQRYPALADALGYTEFFSSRGLPVADQKKCLANLPAAEAVAKESEAISAKGIDSTPTVLINGKKVEGNDWKAVEAALKAAGA